MARRMMKAAAVLVLAVLPMLGQSAWAAQTRGAKDIQALLEAEKPDPQRVARLTQAADRQPPDDATPAQLVTFYFERGNAAAELGRQPQRLADLTQAAELSSRTEAGDRGRILQELSRAQARSGRWLDAIATRQQEIDFVQTAGRGFGGRLFSAYSFMATTAANSGDLAGAQRWADQAERLLGKAAAWRNYPLYSPGWRGAVLDARAAVATQAGRLAEAEQLLSEAIAQIDQAIASLPDWPKENLPPPGTQEQWRDATVMRRAQVLARQGRLVEAEVEMLPALTSQIKRRGRYSAETADALVGYVMLLLELNRGQEAETLAGIAVDIYEKVGHERTSLSLARARVQYARALSFQRKDAQAVALFEQVEADLAAVDRAQAERLVRGQGAYALALLRTGQPERAAQLLRATVEQRSAAQGADHLDTAELRGMLGMALAASGDRAGALAAFKTSIPELIRGTEALGANGPPVRRVHTLTMILEAYLGLLADLVASGERSAGLDLIAESFRIADVAHGSSVQQAIAANAARAAASSPELADLVRQEQDGRQRLSALRALLAEQLALPSGQSSAEIMTGLRQEIRQLESQVGDIDATIDRRFPAFADLMRPRPVTPAQVQAALAADEALVLTYVGEDRLFAWALAPGRAPAFAATPMARREVTGLVRRLRGSLDPNKDDAPPLDLAAAHQLYQAILAPVASGWEGARVLSVVPDKALGQLPFSLLVTEPTAATVSDAPGQPPFAAYRDVPWLVRRLAVAQLPSAAALLALRDNKGRPAARAFIGFGDPLFNERQADEARAEQQAMLRGPEGKAIRVARRSLPTGAALDGRLLRRLPRLPDTADEVRAIAGVLGADPAQDVVLGAAVNIATIRGADLSDRRVVMFATHGLKANDLPGLTQPALALSNPQLAQVDGNGLLTVDDVLGLKLNADWVVLSACNTAAPEGEGAEAVSGLGRAFFYAGTRAVLVTSWAVETTSAAMLTTETFRRVAATPGLGRAEALRQAMLAVMDAPGLRDPASGRIEYSYAHPMFWAPYILVGDGRN